MSLSNTNDKKEYWFEIFKHTDNGTETVDTVDTEEEALKYIAERPNETLYYDEWEMNSDGSGVAKRNPLYKVK